MEELKSDKVELRQRFVYNAEKGECRIKVSIDLTGGETHIKRFDGGDFTSEVVMPSEIWSIITNAYEKG